MEKFLSIKLKHLNMADICSLCRASINGVLIFGQQKESVSGLNRWFSQSILTQFIPTKNKRLP